jgi:hypothetical protein
VLQRFTTDIWPAVEGYNAHPSQGGSERDGSGLRLADTKVTALNPPTAALQVCYTFTAQSYQGGQPVQTPTTSAAHFELLTVRGVRQGMYRLAIRR